MIVLTKTATHALNTAQKHVGVSDDAHLDIVDALVFVSENPEFADSVEGWEELADFVKAHGADPLACEILGE
jgi:hypothetical protein